MKIAFVIRDYAPSRGGQERYLARLIGALAGRGHDLHVFASRIEAGAEGGFAFHRVPVPSAGPSLRALLFIRRARRLLAAEAWDVVSGLDRFYPIDVCRLGGGVHRVWLRERSDTAAGRLLPYTRPFTWLALHLEKRMFDPRRCRRIITNSRLCRDQLLDLYPYPRERVSVIYNGVDHEAFHLTRAGARREEARRELGIPDGAPAAIFVSNNPGRKGLETVLRALALPGSGGPHLIVAGRGRTGRFAALARDLGVAGRVRFLGPVRDVRPYYGAADYLVLPTRYDPFANVCLEAMACGLPVVTTRMNGASEIVAEGTDGLVLDDPRDAGALAGAMGTLAARGVRTRMGEAARGKSLAFTVVANAEATLGVYRLAMEERDGRPH